MIQYLSNHYQKTVARFFCALFYMSIVLPSMGAGGSTVNQNLIESKRSFGVKPLPSQIVHEKRVEKKGDTQSPIQLIPQSKKFIDGPSQPEMSSFKSIGTDNMVNLFTGDFNYNIPLLDVGGYPVNIFYNGTPGIEQEASWVGLGWNINPGNINRTMRGVPDDFNGEEILQEEQQIKPNKTWGVRLGIDFEFAGLKGGLLDVSVGEDLGVSVNNYLGPALELGIKGGVTFNLMKKVLAEKSGIADSAYLFTPKLSVGANLSSRDGLTISPALSLTGRAFESNKSSSYGLSLGTSYNSRYGIKELQISGQISEFKQLAASTTISFTRPTYVPTIRMPLSNYAFTGHVQLGAGLFGLFPSLEVEGYAQSSRIDPANTIQRKPMVGYLYYQNAVNDPSAVMDFSRLNDKEVTSKTPIISAPLYAYDVFSVQGEGTGGTFRAYRNDQGYIRDNSTRSEDNSGSIGLDIGGGHFGANLNVISTPSSIGEWTLGNKLKAVANFGNASQLHENVYFRNPGENSVLTPHQFDRIGGTDLVRFKLGGSSTSPTIEPRLERFSKSGYSAGTPVNLVNTQDPAERKKRSQVISFLTAEEASVAGLDKVIKNYSSSTILEADTLKYETLPRVTADLRKKHHISQVNITEADGKRYVYGIPVYNKTQKDFTFSVKASSEDGIVVPVKNPNWMTTGSDLLNSSITGGTDGYVQITTTPPYAHSFLLSGLLSPDYVDVKGDGITEDDLGTAVKFNYTKIAGFHQWRTPLSSGSFANFNTGNRSETRDDKGIVSYGERESWYMHSIESKTMIALFTLAANRNDGKGARNELGDIKSDDQTIKRLSKIDLYNKADLKAHGLVGANAAKPVKTVHFGYSYKLCPGTSDNVPDNAPDQEKGIGQGSGKLTLDSIWFTFNGQTRASKNVYRFAYANNSAYAKSSSDRWSTYKPAALNPGGLNNIDYPYSAQPSEHLTREEINNASQAWALQKILLPSGGQIEVSYESDDYAFVQNKRASSMMQVVGFGNSSDLDQKSNSLYNSYGDVGPVDNNYVFIKVARPCTNPQDVFQYYLNGQSQFVFRYAVLMTKGEEYLTCYADLDMTVAGSALPYGVTSDPSIIWIRLKQVGNFSPLSLTAVEYLREHLPGQAFKGYDVTDESGFDAIIDLLVGMVKNLKNGFTDPINALHKDGSARIVPQISSSYAFPKCFLRLNDPIGFKCGGGNRVKSILLKDNWHAMTGQFTSVYGQSYNYTTNEIFNGTKRTISSGVASYEPSIGGEENPFQSIVHVNDKLPLGPATYGSIEMPILDALFPGSSVGYSKVTVRPIRSTAATEKATNKKSRSGIGKQVTEYYTAKDFPVYYSNTSLDPSSDMRAHAASTTNFFYKHAFDSRALSQGFLVETNDMHGKMKSQSSYAESDTNTRINYTENFYRNTGSKGLDEQFDFVYGNQSGKVEKGNMGIDIELMNDAREFIVQSKSVEVQFQFDLFPIFFPIWLPFLWPVTGNSENNYRAVTSTKVINYHSILDSVVVIDKGSVVSTKNLVYDAETGTVVVNRTNNEFNTPIYSTHYPAYWAYPAMGPAYKNIDALYSNVTFSDGRIMSGFDNSVFESGDELLVLPISPQADHAPAGDCHTSIHQDIIWAYDINRNTSSLAGPHDFIFLDSAGKIYTRAGVNFRIIRSGKRNMLDASAATVTSMINPVQAVSTGSSNMKLIIGNNSNVVNATAIEYKEKWQTEQEAFRTLKTIPDPTNSCNTIEVEDCDGYLEKQINPYRKGILGTFRPFRNMVFYDNRKEGRPANVTGTFPATNLSKNGLIDNFKLYWDFNNNGYLMQDITSSQWVWNNQSTRFNAKGMELENKNALNIFTAAQYGYNNTLPVAITNNAQYSEIAYDGFEDNDYKESLSKANYPLCANKKHIDFTSYGANVANVISLPTTALPFNAHSGNRVLEIKGNQTAAKTVGVGINSNTDFNLLFGTESNKVLNQLGGTSSYTCSPSNLFDQYSNANIVLFSSETPNINMSFMPHDNNGYAGKRQHNYVIYDTCFIEVKESKIYNFKLSLKTTYPYASKNQNSFNSSNQFAGAYSNSFGINIYSINNLNKAISNQSIYSGYPGYNTDSSFSVFLCKGIYKLIGSATENYYPPYDDNGYSTQNSYEWSSSDNKLSSLYKNLTTVNQCSYTVPIAGDNTMLHPIFNLPSNKKMWFSAWVKGNCANANGPCPPVTFDNGNIKVQVAGAELKPSGPVIDGWQKIEGVFTVPNGYTSMPINFVNNNATSIYLDDIRIHPYNANMKSYVYDPINLRLVAELDANNYASYYEYDEEGTLVRTKAETKEGIKTIKETRSAKQKNIVDFQ